MDCENKNPKSSSPEMSEEIKDYLSKYPQSYPLCKDVRRYQILMKIGQGTFGEVFKAQHRKTKRIVALKRIIKKEKDAGFPVTSLREIEVLQKLNHVNIVNLRRVCCSSPCKANHYQPDFYLVFDFADHDLAGLLSNKQLHLNLPEIKSILKQLLSGISYLHKNNILHRDIKSSNVLLHRNGVLKLTDFGLSRFYTKPEEDKPNRYTARVVTLWYRPPEILLGERNYGPPIDMWAVGCIMAEMWTRCPIMQGDNEGQQLVLIFGLCGSIKPSVWPDVSKMPHYNKIVLPHQEPRRLKDRLGMHISDALALDLIDKLLMLDPSRRKTAEQAMMHDFFFEDPMAGDLSELFNKYPDSSFLEYLTPRQHVDYQHPFNPKETVSTGIANMRAPPNRTIQQVPASPTSNTKREQEIFENAF